MLSAAIHLWLFHYPPRSNKSEILRAAQDDRMVAFRQNRQLAASSFYDRLNAGNGMKSELHPICSTAACSLHLFPMNILSRAFAFCCLGAANLVSIAPVSAQDLFAAANPSPSGPDSTRLLRFPT